MKKHSSSIAATIAAVACVFAAAIVMAGSVGDRSVQALSATAGTATWTNDRSLAALKLTRISVVGSSNATNVITVSRIVELSTGTYTQTVGTVTCSGGAGTQATLAYSGLLYGDQLAFASLVATGSVAIIEYEVQKH
jgi:hypothetical protein